MWNLSRHCFTHSIKLIMFLCTILPPYSQISKRPHCVFLGLSVSNTFMNKQTEKQSIIKACEELHKVIPANSSTCLLSLLSFLPPVQIATHAKRSPSDPCVLIDYLSWYSFKRRLSAHTKNPSSLLHRIFCRFRSFHVSLQQIN